MSEEELEQRVVAEFARREKADRRRGRFVGIFVLVAFLGGGYYAFGLPNGGSKGCGQAPSGGADVQGLLQGVAYSDCVKSLAQAKPPATVFRGRLNSSAQAVADRYLLDEWVKRDCAAATRLFHPVRTVYAPECGLDQSEHVDIGNAFLVAGRPKVKVHCEDYGYYRLRASECYVYRFILHTNKMSSSVDSLGRVTRYWEYDINPQEVWLRIVHGHWRVILEDGETDKGYFVGDPGYAAAKRLWTHRVISHRRQTASR